MGNKENDTWKHDFPLTLAEAEVVLASLREQEYWSLRERNANNELIERIERQIREIDKFKEECGQRAKEPEYLVGI
jgi:hypothetical protein